MTTDTPVGLQSPIGTGFGSEQGHFPLELPSPSGHTNLVAQRGFELVDQCMEAHCDLRHALMDENKKARADRHVIYKPCNADLPRDDL